jgi:hypothetical protein
MDIPNRVVSSDNTDEDTRFTTKHAVFLLIHDIIPQSLAYLFYNYVG